MAAACVILLCFSAESCKSNRNGSVKVANAALAAKFFDFGTIHFPFKIPFKNRFKIVVFPLWRRDPALELQFLILFASFKVQSSTGTCFVQALQYKVVLGRALCKLCSTK